MESIIINMFLVIFIILFSLFLYKYKKDSRTLFMGFLLVLMLFILAIYMALLILKHQEIPYLFTIAAIILVVFMLLIIFLTIALFITLFVTGIKLVKREGVKPSHMLSLGLGILYTIYIIFWPMFYDLTKNSIFNIIYYSLNTIIYYLAFLMAMFVLTLLINLIPKRKSYKYIITLGAGLINDKPTPLLKARVDKAIKMHNKNKGSKIIMSGGKGNDEIVSESYAMTNYAISKGVLKDNIILESNSKNTFENIKFSYEIIKSLGDENSNVLVVTSYYHVLRALIIAKNQNIKCDGAGSMTKFYYALNAIIREFIGYLYIKRSLHIKVISVIIIFNFIIMLLNQFAY